MPQYESGMNCWDARVLGRWEANRSREDGRPLRSEEGKRDEKIDSP